MPLISPGTLEYRKNNISLELIITKIHIQSQFVMQVAAESAAVLANAK